MEQVFFASEWFFMAVAAFRLAIVCLYLELSSTLTIALVYRPIDFNWNPTVKGTCEDAAKTEYASAGFNLTVGPPGRDITNANTAAFLLRLICINLNRSWLIIKDTRFLSPYPQPSAVRQPHACIHRTKQSKVRTIGSSGRKRPQRKLQSTTLLNSHDDDVER
ncbi:hypothetical protein BBP40_004738 [Aspergillus hancockii]|nr:hypothetical protein BBP40_004738 [Aspergillus hancockii]